MSDENDIKRLYLGPSTTAHLFKLSQPMIDYLWERIDVAKRKKISLKNVLAGHISHSYKLEDPQNLIIQNILDKLYNSDSEIENEIHRVYKKIENKNNAQLEPYLRNFWVNFQKKGEFQPLHNHTGVFSFVIWMDIPYDYKDESKLNFAKSNCKDSPGGNFSFVYSDDVSRAVSDYFIKLSPSMNGYCCLFPSDLIHHVHPFYTSDKDRISISGNISFNSTDTTRKVEQVPFHIS
tara:strand:- start:79 stop:783 length:705 start_codon:yes stop_codon:yes gene_type:complete